MVQYIPVANHNIIYVRRGETKMLLTYLQSKIPHTLIGTYLYTLQRLDQIDTLIRMCGL